MQTCIMPTTRPAPLMPPLEAAANEKLASGVSTSLNEANVWQTRTFTPELRWGNDYMHARYYNLNLGRFLSVDPIGGTVGSSQSWNRYSYVRNNPLNLIDPDGQADRRTDQDKKITEDPDVMVAVVEIVDNMAEDGNEWGVQIVVAGENDFDTEGVFTSGKKNEIDFSFRKDSNTGEIRSEGSQPLAAVMHGHPQASGLADPFKKTSGPNRVLGTEASPADKNVATVAQRPNFVIVKDKMMLKVAPVPGGKAKSTRVLTKSDYRDYLERARQQ